MLHCKSQFNRALPILLLAAWLTTAVRPAVAQEKILRWHDNLDRAAQAARASGKPVFVVFRCVR